MQAPLLIGCDVRNMTKHTMEIIANREVIDVNQGNLISPIHAYWFSPISGNKSDSLDLLLYTDLMLLYIIDPLGIQARKVRSEGDQEVNL